MIQSPSTTRDRLAVFPTAFLLFVAFLQPLRAELKWDAQKIDLKPRPTDTVAEADFGFVNAGKEAVTIELVKSSCGCTVPTLAKTDYAPGERGEVLARFSIGERKGNQSATIRVTTKGVREPVVLTLNVAIPEVAKMTPAMVMWQAGEKAEPKTIQVDAVPGQSLRVTKVTSSAPNFAVRLETIEEGSKYRVLVTPSGMERPAFALLKIETQIADGVKTLSAYAQVRVPGASPLPGVPVAAIPPVAELELEPAVLVWDAKSESSPKALSVRAPAGGTAKVIKATASSPNFDTKVETIKESVEYRITVTPRSTAAEELAFVNIECESARGATTRRAYVQIKPR